MQPLCALPSPQQQQNGPFCCCMTCLQREHYNVSCSRMGHSFTACRGWWECTTRFLSLVTLTIKLVRARDQTCLMCEFGANPFSGSRDIWFTNKQSDRQRQNRNLTQFDACGKECVTQGQQAASSEHDQSVAITTLSVSKYSTTVTNTTIAQLYSRLTKSKLLHRQNCTLLSATLAITTLNPYPNLERWSIYFCTQYTTPSVKYFPSSDLMTVGKGIQIVKIIQSSLLGNVLQPAVTPERHNNNNNNRFMALCPGLPGWAGTRRNIYPPTVLIIIQSLSASSVYYYP